MDKNQPLIDALLDALTLEWSDNGNISADGVRDACISTLATQLGMSFNDVVTMVEQKVMSNQ